MWERTLLCEVAQACEGGLGCRQVAVLMLQHQQQGWNSPMHQHSLATIACRSMHSVDSSIRNVNLEAQRLHKEALCGMGCPCSPSSTSGSSAHRRQESECLSYQMFE